MKSILQDLYNGQVYPAEQLKPSGAEYETLQSKITAERTYFTQKLSPADSTRFEDMENLYMGALDIEVFTGFSHGMRLGMLLTLELLAEGKAT